MPGDPSRPGESSSSGNQQQLVFWRRANPARYHGIYKFLVLCSWLLEERRLRNPRAKSYEPRAAVQSTFTTRSTRPFWSPSTTFRFDFSEIFS
ncbi:MAG TPA: hypothetical protein VEK08_02830, partial [Planctomycetota bacterium]|nr:hypothetical protein [Planctomycetota bacterium]